MATNYPTLVTTRYVTSGAYIGQLIVPAPTITPDTRIPCYVGVGSRFAVAKNSQIRRAFVYDAALTFSPVAPYYAVLPFEAANDKSVARIVKSDGTEVKQNQWQFIKVGQQYTTVEIAREIFDPVAQYTISYQSVDRNVLDAFPVNEIREFMAVGSGPDAHDYTEYTDFFADYKVGYVDQNGNLQDQLNPDVGNDPASLLSTVTTPVPGANTGSGSVALNVAAAFNHDYNRFYTVRCTNISSTSPTGVATFEWTAQPTSSGNNNLPAVPLDPAAPKPTFTVTQATPASLTQTLELGVKLDFTFGGTNFVIGDVWTFNGYGPALVEVDARHANTNQYHEQGAITKSAGTGYATLAYDGTSEPLNTYNSKYKVECTAATDTSVKATIANLTHDGTNGLAVTAKKGGEAGNSITFGLLDPGVPNSPLVVNTSGNTVQVSLATDNGGSIVSTLADVVTAVNASATCPVTALAVGSASTIAYPWLGTTVAPYQSNSRITVNISGSTVSAPEPTPANFATTLKVGSKVRFSTQPNSVYTVLSGLTNTGFTISPAYTGTPVSATALTGTAVTTLGSPVVTTASGTFAGALSAGARVKFGSDPDHVYTVLSVTGAGPYTITLTSPFAVTGSGTDSGTLPGAEVIEVSQGLASGAYGTFTGTLAWAEYGERINISGISTYSYTQAATAPANPTMSLSNGVVLELGLDDGPFVAGDTFGFTVLAPREFYQAKDNRAITLTTDAVPVGGIGSGSVAMSYTTNTVEGGFGSITPAPEDNSYIPTSSQWKHGWFTMSGNINCAVRNMHGGPTTGTTSGTGNITSSGTAVTGAGTDFEVQLDVGDYITASGQTVKVTAITSATALTTSPAFSPAVSTASFTILRNGNRHVVGNKFTFSATIDGTINWSPTRTKSETIAKASILTDVIGAITGVPATPYLILANVPETVLSVTEAVSGAAISYSLVTASDGSNTQYITFVTKPTVDVKVQYIYKGAEPVPGQIYYVTSKHIRPDELYNQPILIRSLDDGRRLLGPSETTNHLYIMNEVAMGDIAAPAIYIVQVKDADGDTQYTDVDFADAIAASETPRNISDLIVLSHFSTLSQQLNSVNKMADPFKRRFRMTWIGAPIGTTLGSEEEPDTLIYLSRRTLQVYGQNPAHGTRVLVGATYCKRDVKLENQVVTEVTLDGSFVAGALAALVASFADPAETVLRKSLAGFKEIQTYGDVESPTNLTLGAANIIFWTDQGNSVYRTEEDVTVDTFAPDYNLINNMTQKMYVVKQVRQQLDDKLIGIVVPSAGAGVAFIRGFLVQILTALLGRGLIGAYQTVEGNERPLNTSKDVVVFRDSADPTLYHILFAFYLKNEIKRIFGLYSVNSNDFGG